MLYSDGKQVWLLHEHWKYLDYKKQAKRILIGKIKMAKGYHYLT